VKVRINVEQSDINKGVCGDPGSCAIALSLIRKYKRRKGFEGVHVDVGQASVYFNMDDMQLTLPTKADRFIRNFDVSDLRKDRKALKPFSFYATVVD